MTKYFLTGFVFVLCATACFGQQNAAPTQQSISPTQQSAAPTQQSAAPTQQSANSTHHTWRFRSDNIGGLSIGQMGGYGQVRTVNGLSRGPWFAGLGAGLDYYRFRNIPFFLSVTRDLLTDKRSGLFLILDGGVDLPWYKREPQPYQNLTSTFRAGPYWNTGLGYRWRFSDAGRKALLFSATYGMKTLTERQTTQGTCYDPPACTVTTGTTTYDYTDRTLRVGVGVEL